MNRAVRTTVPPRVTSDTVTTFRTIVTSTLRPARVALTSYVFVSSPASTTISTLSPFIASPRVPLSSAACDVDSSRYEIDARIVINGRQEAMTVASPDRGNQAPGMQTSTSS
jgi:hypothetical protein